MSISQEQDSDSTTSSFSSGDLNEFQERLEEEHDSCDEPDLEALGLSAVGGIPDELRARVWKVLLIPHSSSGVELLSKDSARKCLDGVQLKRLKGELGRFKRKCPTARDLVDSIETIVSTFVYNSRREFSPSLIYMCCPFVYTLRDETDSYLAFEALMKHLDSYYASPSIDERVAQFLALFRLVLPDLYHYFEEEEVNSKEWITPWFRYLLSKELPLHCLLRLWDCYFSHPDGFELHVYIYLSILSKCKDHLEELENSEICAYLSHLPAFDMDEIIHNALNIRHEVELMNKY